MSAPPSPALLDFVRRRQKFGLEKYGHGVRHEDDTRSFGTTRDSWWEMMQEELGDAISYAVCGLLRDKRLSPRAADETDDNGVVIEQLQSGPDERHELLNKLIYYNYFLDFNLAIFL